MSSYSADSIQLRYSDETGKLHELGFRHLTGGYRRIEEGLGFDEENGVVEIWQWFIGDRKIDGASTTCSGILWCS